jgi:hypothetical protein
MKRLQYLSSRHNGIGRGNGRDDVSGYALGIVQALNGLDLKDVQAQVGRGGDESHGHFVVFVEFGQCGGDVSLDTWIAVISCHCAELGRKLEREKRQEMGHSAAFLALFLTEFGQKASYR